MLYYTLTLYAPFLVPDIELFGHVLSMHWLNEFFPFCPAALWGWGMSNEIKQMSFGHHDCSTSFQISASSWQSLQFKYLSAPVLLIYMIKSKRNTPSVYLEWDVSYLSKRHLYLNLFILFPGNEEKQSFLWYGSSNLRHLY